MGDLGVHVTDSFKKKKKGVALTSEHWSVGAAAPLELWKV